MINLILVRASLFRLLLLLQLSVFARAVEDFADVNSILGDVIVKLPDVPTMKGRGYSIELTEVICRNLWIRDASLTSRKVGLVGESSSGVELQWSLGGLTFECDAKYRYKGLFGVANRGDVYLYSRGNHAVATATVSTPLNGSPQPPTKVAMNSCTPEVQIVDIDFNNGGFIGWVLDAIEALLRTTMENMASDKICEELQIFLEVNTKDLLEYITGENVLKPYLPTSTTTAAAIVDPLQYEDNFIQNVMIEESADSASKVTSVEEKSSVTTKLLNLREQDTSTGRWMNELIRKGVDVSNEVMPTPLNIMVKEELRVNQWLRDFVLEDGTGALVLTSSSSGPNGFPGDGILYDGEDLVTHTTIVLDRVKLLGLDTLTRFSPLEAIGDYTLETNLAWRYLALELDATVTVRPSTRPDSVIDTTTSSSAIKIVEEVKVILGVDGLEAGASLMAALNQTSLENSIELGSLLQSGKAATDCLLSTILDLEFATLSLKVTNDILTPSIEGLISPGLDRLVSQSMDASFLLYEEVLLEAAPIYFQNKLRPILSKKILHEHILFFEQDVGENSSSSGVKGNIGRRCLPWAKAETDFGLWNSSSSSKTVDFRDLMLPVEEAIALGGSGSEIYGDLLSGIVVPYINEELLDIESLNEQLIPTITLKQSGKKGVLEFDNVFRYFNKSSSSPLYDTIDCRIPKITFSNLDTVEGPLDFLQPTDRGNVLQNRFAMNAMTDPIDNNIRYLNITFRIYLEIDGDDSPFRMKNEVDFSVSIPSTSFSVEILADLKERSLLEIPLKDIANPFCWLAALGSPIDNYENTKDLAISALSFSLSTFYLDTYCVSASSPGCDSISEVIDYLEEAGLASSFRNSINRLVENIALSLWDALDVKRMINDAPKHCPHSEFYDFHGIKQKSPLEISDISGMSKNSTETILALGIIGLQTAIVVAAKNHLLLADQQIPTLDSQSSITSSAVRSFPEGREIIDWSNLSGQFGSWTNVLFSEFRDSLSRGADTSSNNIFLARQLSSETTPGVNIMLRDYILDDSGYLELGFEDISLTTLGVSISIAKVRIGGLDTITEIEPLIVLDQHKMHTSLHLEELTVSLECNVATVDGIAIDPVVFEYKAKDILLDINTRIALNTTELGQIQVGSLFYSSDVINCMMRGIQAFEISMLNLTLGELESSAIEGSFSSELQVQLSGILDSLRDDYRNDFNLAVPLIAGSTMREIMNAMIPAIIESGAKQCPTAPEFSSTGLVDFRELLLPNLQSKKLGEKGSSSYGDLFQILYGILDKEVMQTGVSNRPVLNDLLKKMTTKQSNTTGTIHIPGSTLDTQSIVQIAGLRADLRIEFLDVLIQNLDSVGDPLYFLQPDDQEAFILHNKVSFGVDSKPLRFQGTMVLSMDDGANMNIRNEINLSFLAKDVTVQASILLKLLENSISSFPLEDLLDINCWAASILPTHNEKAVAEGLQILDQAYSTGSFEMEISCKSCTSPDFDEFLLSLYEPHDVKAAIREQSNSFVDSKFVQRLLKEFLVQSKKRCPHRHEFDPDYQALNIADFSISSDTGFGLLPQEEEKKSIYFSIANFVLASCFIVVGVLAKIMIARRNKKWVRSLTNEGQFLLNCQREKERKIDDWLDENTTSLFASSFIPKSIRWGVPILLLVNTGLYLWGHFGLLSVVNLDITFAGQSFTIDKFLEFRFLESTKNTYDNGGAEMIVLIWICTGIWPYIKLFLSLAIWMAPPKYLSVKRRRSVLLWIDALARLSIIDIFTLIIGFAILLVFIGGRDKSMNEEEIHYVLKFIVVPKAGCYCIIAAQRMSRVSSQFFLEYHGKVVGNATLIRKNRCDMSISQVHVVDQSRVNSSFEIDSLSIRSKDANTSNCQNSQSDLETAGTLSHIPTDVSFFKMSSWKAYKWGNLGAILGGITILIVFIIGLVFAPAIAFDISTLGEITLESEYTYEEAVSEYGVFLVISGILLKARFVLKTRADYIGLGLLLVAAGVSVSLIFVIKSYHFIRQKLRERRERRNNFDQKHSYGHEGCGLPSYFRLYKWNHMEIYFISLCIGVWQLGSIISYSIHLYCCILTDIFDILTSIGIVERTEAQCNRIQASLPGNLVIAIGSFLILLAVFSLQAYLQYRSNLTYASKYIDDKDVPTLSLAWSQDKSKNKQYAHLTESLSLRAFNPDSRNSMAGSTLAMNPSGFSFSETSASVRDYHSRSISKASSATSNTSIQLSPSRDTIEEGPNEDEISVSVSSRISDVASKCSYRSSTIDAACELANTTNRLLTATNIRPQSHQNIQNETLYLERQERKGTSNENRLDQYTLS
jgi:hypothetical protein